MTYQPPGSVPTLRTGYAHPHPEPISGEPYSAVELLPGLRCMMLDQRKLPTLERYEVLDTAEEVAAAIRDMLVRGAPAIGIAAAYGIAVAARSATGDAQTFLATMDEADRVLRASRPTAVNLAWALDRIRRVVVEVADMSVVDRATRVAAEARSIHREDVASCHAIGRNALSLIPEKTGGATVLTHCNAGALATGGYGTALGVIRAAFEAGKVKRVIACETRPYLQGARLTAWELVKSGIPVEVITDSMAGHFFSKGAIDMVVVGADRIAKNGDVANKIGTYSHACLARAHEVPFYVAAPWSTVDLACASGEGIPIEERHERELLFFSTPDGAQHRVVPEGAKVRNPAFDVTPARLVTAVVTERGVVRGALG